MAYKIFDGSYFTNESSEFNEYDEELNEFGGMYDDDEDEDEEEEEDDYFEGENYSPRFGRSFNDEEDEEEDEEDYDDEFESLVFDGDELYEAKIRLNAKEKLKRNAMSELMRSLNKESDYVAAKEKFFKVYNVMAKKKIKELGLKIKPANLDKVTLRQI